MFALENETIQTISTEGAVHSKGAIITVTKSGKGVGMPMLTVACPAGTSFLSTLNSPVYSMQLRGFAGSQV